MNYPFWNVEVIGSGWVIGIIAIFHVMISHFAVGGGIIMPILEHIWSKEKNGLSIDELLRRSMKFFLVLTGVLGTVSGVGIWFSIGLASPQVTSTLIRTFVFFWAIEWIFFLIELTAAIVYFYSWGRISKKHHLIVGYLYAGSSFMTLFVITGILSFMLSPSEKWLQYANYGEFGGVVLSGFFNPTFWASFILRGLACIAIATVVVAYPISKIPNYPIGKQQMTRQLAFYFFLPSFILTPLALFWYLASIPNFQQQLIFIPALGLLRHLIIAIVFAFMLFNGIYIFAWKNATRFNSPKAWILILLTVILVGNVEHMREIIRKPYAIGGYMYSNGTLVSERSKYNSEGYLKNSLWINKETDFGMGEAMFRGQCLCCHTIDGYRSIKKMLNRNPQNIESMLDMLYEYNSDYVGTHYMPPLVGTIAERRALKSYLQNLK